MDDWVILAPTRWQLHDAVAQSNLILEQLKLSQAPEKTFIGRASRGFDFLGYHLTPEQLTVSKTALQRRDARLHRLYEQGANDLRVGEYVSRWQRWAKAGLTGSLTETADFNPPPRPRIPHKLPFEAQFLAMGAASLLGAAASDSHATIWYTDLSSASLPIRANFEVDGDTVADVQGNSFNGYAKFHALNYNVVGRTAGNGGKCTDGGAAGGSTWVFGTCIAGHFGGGVHAGWSSAAPATHWVKFKTSSGKFGLLRVQVDASLLGLGFVTGYAFDDSGANFKPIDVPAIQNTINGYPPPPQINVVGAAVSTYTVSLSTTGTGHGTVTGAGSYPVGTAVTLGATPDASSVFAGWSPDSCKTGMTLTADTTCTATFNTTVYTPPPPPPDPTKVSFFLKVDGNGSGNVTTDAGMSCQTSDCHSVSYDENSSGVACSPSCQTIIDNSGGPTSVTLTPKADYGSYFGGWGGHPDCVDGQLIVTGGRLCIAFFDKQQATLFVTLDGSGQGQVSANVGKLDWTSNHEAHAAYDMGTAVVLTATALPGSYLVGWGGDEDCLDGKVNLTSQRACVAHFNLYAEPTHRLTTEANPTPLLLNPPAVVTTTLAVPATTPPVGTTTPTTTQTIPTEVVAQAVIPAPVTFLTAKLGPGNLRSDPAGIDCGTTCQASYPAGTVVTLTATPTDGATFKEWSGDCNSPELTTTVTVKTDTHCQATFAEATPGVTLPSVPVTPPMPVTTSAVTPPSVPATTPTATSPSVPETTPVTTPTPVIVTPPPVITLVPVTLAGANFACSPTGDIAEACNYGGREVTDLNVLGSGTVSNGVLNTTVVNHGWVSNFHITTTGKLSGGVVTGYIKNEGVMLDFEFVGMSILGGTLGGVITNNSRVGGFFQDVTLLPNTKITGGILSGIIKGDKNAPALLENVRVKGRSKLSGVKLGKGVKLEKGVLLEEKQ
jgi:hypothetical protein